MGLISLLLLFLTACGSKMESEQKAIQSFISHAPHDLENKYNLHRLGTGTAKSPNGPCICIHYYSYQFCSLNQARRLIVEIGSDMLQRMNQNKGLKNLPNYPFQIEDLQTGILFANVSPYDLNHLAMVILCNGRISYSSYTYPNELKPIHRETFEEALTYCRLEKME